MPWYKTGTVTVTNGSPAVVGVGTTWGNGAITPGDSFSLVDASGAAVSPHYEVLTVTDDTHLTLTANYGGTTAAGAKYALWNLAGEHTTPYLSALVSALVQRCAASMTPSTTTPQTSADTGSAGTSAQYARGDHVHPRRPEVKVYINDESDETILAATKAGDIIIKKVTV